MYHAYCNAVRCMLLLILIDARTSEQACRCSRELTLRFTGSSAELAPACNMKLGVSFPVLIHQETLDQQAIELLLCAQNGRQRTAARTPSTSSEAPAPSAGSSSPLPPVGLCTGGALPPPPPPPVAATGGQAFDVAPILGLLIFTHGEAREVRRP